MAKVIKTPVKKAVKKTKVYTKYRPSIYSRHPSHNVLRTELPLLPFRSVVRLGSVTDKKDGKVRVECNTVEAVERSADKLLMKEAFANNNVVTAEWGRINQLSFPSGPIKYPIVVKNRWGSRGTGNTLINNIEEYTRWAQGKTLSNYIWETFHDYVREYRLHVTADGCFYTCRKMLKGETPEKDRWYRNDSNSIWVVEENKDFDKPSNWDAIVAGCVAALNAVGLDVGACDVKVQGAETSKGKVRKDPKWFVIEINSAPSFGRITAEKYLQVIPEILNKKKNGSN